MLELHLAQHSISRPHLSRILDIYSDSVDLNVFVYVLAVEDFDSFNEFMMEKNKELDAEAKDRWWRTKDAPSMT